jgi:hypothetical protein
MKLSAKSRTLHNDALWDFYVHMVANIKFTVFWDLYPEDEGNIFLRNRGTSLPNYKVLSRVRGSMTNVTGSGLDLLALLFA